MNVIGELPAVYGYWLGWIVIAGNALKGNGPSRDEKPVMNCAAREKTELKSSGVSNGFGKGDSPSAARI